MVPVVRIVLGVIGAGLFLLGLFLISVGGSTAVAGIWPVISGSVLLLAVFLERQRYRSEAAERSTEPAGPGGGEPAAVPSPFRPTDERFVDPTTNRVMRVYQDPRTGERRYHAEA